MSDAWYYEENGKGVGPLLPEQLKVELLKRPDWRDQFVWRTGAKDWIKAGDVPELATIPPPIPPQQTTTPPSVAPEEPATAPPIVPEEQTITPTPLVPDEPTTAPPLVIPDEPAITPPPVVLKEPELEQFLYKRSRVVITPTLARFDNVTYPISGIGSVRVDPPRRWLALSFAVVLGFFGYLVLLGDAKGEATSLATVCFAGSLLCLIWAFGKPYRLMLGTASGNQQAYVSFKSDVLEKMKQAIEKAVVHRG